MAVKSSLGKDGVAKVVLNHPPLNILTREVMSKLRRSLTELESDESLRAVVLTAEGKHFSAGADVGEHLPPEYEELIPEFIETVQAIYQFPLPVIAAVHGRCLGGGFELVQAADVVIAGEGATFGQPEIVLGVFPPAACALLPQLCPPSVAADLIFGGGTLDAGGAKAAGLVRRVVPDEEVLSAALQLAGKLAKHSGKSLRVTKRALRAAAELDPVDALNEAGRVYVEELMTTEDAVEGLKAFTEKREAKWKHR